MTLLHHCPMPFEQLLPLLVIARVLEVHPSAPLLGMPPCCLLGMLAPLPEPKGLPTPRLGTGAAGGGALRLGCCLSALCRAETLCMKA